jgi:hypothetical protein
MMSPAAELQDFQSFLSAKIAVGQIVLSPEEALDEWRSAHPNQATAAEDLAAIREALDDFAAGDRGVDWREFDREFRQRHGLQTES